jgi:hypothetical protein
MKRGALTLATYPFDDVRIGCNPSVALARSAVAPVVFWNRTLMVSATLTHAVSRTSCRSSENAARTKSPSAAPGTTMAVVTLAPSAKLGGSLVALPRSTVVPVETQADPVHAHSCCVVRGVIAPLKGWIDCGFQS